MRASGGALLVDPESPEALAAGMRQMQDYPATRSELARRGREYAVETLALETTLARFEQAILG